MRVCVGGCARVTLLSRLIGVICTCMHICCIYVCFGFGLFYEANMCVCVCEGKGAFQVSWRSCAVLLLYSRQWCTVALPVDQDTPREHCSGVIGNHRIDCSHHVLSEWGKGEKRVRGSCEGKTRVRNAMKA